MFQNGGIASGTLTGGYFSQKTWIPASQAGVPTGPSAPTALASTAYSYLFYGWGGFEPRSRYGCSGATSGGTFRSCAATVGFGIWDKLAGTSDSILFYKSSSGITATATLVSGYYSYRTTSNEFGPDWQTIAGGK